MERVQAKLVEDVAGNGDVRGVAHKRHRKHKGTKEEERTTKKHKGSKEVERTTNKHKGSKEAMKFKVVVGARSKQQKGGRKTKLVTWRLSEELLDHLRTKEVMGFIATEMPRPLRPNISGELFDQKLKEEIIAQFKENREFDAYVLYQYRTKGYAEIQEELVADLDDEGYAEIQEEVDDDVVV